MPTHLPHPPDNGPPHGATLCAICNHPISRRPDSLWHHTDGTPRSGSTWLEDGGNL